MENKHERILHGVLNNDTVAYYGNVQVFQQGLNENAYSTLNRRFLKRNFFGPRDA